ncbi:hypothetical protein COO91_09560 (plasmid) [Nostoc flagelliforme CCNUN1]|uniref:Uncharacterized protein n=1 Tax=Nostoc flagelliforme CCNUN1 TaxID=2038116 RepID=A0A2K8T8H9_9NOSO|nr:hypothetical protein COO91_09560 [Nostoc flagelliforme CCNUN1]
MKSTQCSSKALPENKMPSPCGLGAVAHGGNPQERATEPDQ